MAADELGSRALSGRRLYSSERMRPDLAGHFRISVEDLENRWARKGPQGSNPCLAAIDLRKRSAPVDAAGRVNPVCALVSAIFLPSGRRPAPDEPGRRRTTLPLTAASDDLIQVPAGTGQPFRHRVDVDLERQRATVGMTELRCDAGASSGQYQRRHREEQRLSRRYFSGNTNASDGPSST